MERESYYTEEICKAMLHYAKKKEGTNEYEYSFEESNHPCIWDWEIKTIVFEDFSEGMSITHMIDINNEDVWKFIQCYFMNYGDADICFFLGSLSCQIKKDIHIKNND